jgi:hypothetical protein
MLPAQDAKYLNERAPNHSVTQESNMTCIVIPGFQLPSGYKCKQADLLLRLSAGYPDVPPDMWWFDPPLRREDGKVIPATEVVEHHVGRSWQRWSRHFGTGQWQSGIDSLESFVALVRREVERAVPEPVQ